MGDSVMQFAGPGIEAALDSTGEVRTSSIAYPGWGLTTIAQWRTELPAAIAKFKPNIVMGTWSWDKEMALDHPTAYRRLLHQALSVILAPGNGVRGMIFLQFPAVGPNLQHIVQNAAGSKEINHALEAWNGIVASEATQHPGSVGYLPVASSIELGGGFTTWLPDASGEWVRVRSTDDFHLCPAGTARYASAILTDLNTNWELPAPKRKWWRETWIHDPLYYYNGLCPNDHPPGR